MKSTKEIYEALLAGKKLCMGDWAPNYYVYLDEAGRLVDPKGCSATYYFNYPEHWSVWEEKLTFESIMEAKRIQVKIHLPNGDLQFYQTPLSGSEVVVIQMAFDKGWRVEEVKYNGK